MTTWLLDYFLRRGYTNSEGQACQEVEVLG